jgi:DNA-binding PadR family transcriptional regulator
MTVLTYERYDIGTDYVKSVIAMTESAAASTLGYGLLGLLARTPLSGYELAQQMKGTVRFFWHARHSQIYPELARLEAAGLVTHEVVPQHDRPDKKVYSPTPAGMEALRRWVTAPTEPLAVRDELVLKAYSLWLADPASAVALFREHERLHRAQLARYEEFRQQFEQEYSSILDRADSPEWASYATLRRGLLYEREVAEWCAWVAGELERHLSNQDK